MEYYEYYLKFPEGDQQPVDHPLHFGDIVDVNGNVYDKDTLDPYKIAYRVSGIQKKIHFKEISIFYKLDLLNRDEVEGEKKYLMLQAKKRQEKLDKVFSKLEKKLLKKKGFWKR